MGLRSGVSIRTCGVAASANAANDVPSSREVDIQNEIDESERATIQTTLDTRPSNTKRKYEGYQKEFVQWCISRDFPDRDTVTGGKLHLFLSSMVIGRKSKKNKEKTVGGSTVSGYVNALVDLYSQQVTLRTNSNQHPRTAAVKQLIKNVQAKSTETKKKTIQTEVLDRCSMATPPRSNSSTFVTLFLLLMICVDVQPFFYPTLDYYVVKMFAI
eukprot:jgi/Phyca11/546054/estExt2_Genewise1Plus.C_PHYCAscaffold_200033